jgi:membrane-associated phospholipid phosphatase
MVFKRKAPGWERKVHAGKYGYPSAHAMNAAAFYSLLLFLSGLNRSMRAITGCTLFLILIGLSRVKLGIHFMLDMIAGLASGLFLNMASLKTHDLFFRR